MSFKLTREFYIPKGATKVADRLSDAVAYVYATGKGAPAAAIFWGTQAKPIAHYRFRSEAERVAKVAAYFKARQETQARKAAELAERKAWRHAYKVGDLFRSSWGYEQTNVDWYEVTAVRGAHLVVRKIAQERSYGGSDHGRCVPLPGEFIGEPMRKLAQNGFFKVASYANAYYVKPDLVAGVPVYEASSWSSWH